MHNKVAYIQELSLILAPNLENHLSKKNITEMWKSVKLVIIIHIFLKTNT
jgi:hypothetical protein